MSYFNYHAKVKLLIKQGLLEKISFVDNYNNIKPAMVLFFRDNKPMPIRQYRWQEYFDFIDNIEDYF